MSVKSTALTLFDDADVQMDITRSVRVDYYPVHNIIANAPIEFNIAGSPDEYIDLGDIRILLHLKMTKKDKKAWTAASALSLSEAWLEDTERGQTRRRERTAISGDSPS